MLDDYVVPGNRVLPREEVNEYLEWVPLLEGVTHFSAGWASGALESVGALVGTDEMREAGVAAERYSPELTRYDRTGHDLDEVSYHAGYHHVLRAALGAGAHSFAWRDPRAGSHAARAAVFMLFSQVEPGHSCPVSMTHSAVPVLREEPRLAERFEPLLTSLSYDSKLAPLSGKESALCGMALTEPQGGSDLRGTSTRAQQCGPGEYQVSGEKWFCSALMCDLFLTLARTKEGVTCFLVPRVRDDGMPNGFHIRRLKDKLGNRSNASGEVLFDDAYAYSVGEPGRGIALMMKMVTRDRLDTILGACAGMRGSVVEAIWYAQHRVAFGGRLMDKALMLNVLADLCLEQEAATLAALRLASTFDDGAPQHDQLLARIATPALKYWITKRGPNHAFEAMECLGGNGYTETFPMARRYREAPLQSIWEGSGNVVCLDVIRALQVAGTKEALIAELAASQGVSVVYDNFVAELVRDIASVTENQARIFTERVALALEAGWLLRWSVPQVADAFCLARLGEDRRLEYGTLPNGVDSAAIVSRHANIS